MATVTAPATFLCTAPFETKAIDVTGRVIEGYAAVFGNVDAYRDVIDPTAFDRTLSQKRPADIRVLLGHQANLPPVGKCLELRVDQKGLFTRTYIFPTTEGNDLLIKARMLADDQQLGMSIGFYARDARYEQAADGTPIRRLTDIDLVEYSFVGIPANSEARVVSVKSLGFEPGGALADAPHGGAFEPFERKEVTESDWAGIARDLPKMTMTDLVATHRRLHQWAARGTTLTGFTRADMERLHNMAEKELRRRAEADGREPPEPTPLEWGKALAALLDHHTDHHADHHAAPSPQAGLEAPEGAEDDDLKHLPQTVQQVIAREKEKESQGRKKDAPGWPGSGSGSGSGTGSGTGGAEVGVGEEMELRAGRVMSQRNLDRLHEVVRALTDMHGAVCDMGDSCPMRAGGSGGSGGSGGGGGNGTSSGSGTGSGSGGSGMSEKTGNDAARRAPRGAREVREVYLRRLLLAGRGVR